MLKSLALAVSILALTGMAAGAAQLKVADPVPGHSQFIVLDLMRQVVTNLAIDPSGYGTGGDMEPLRPIDGTASGETPAAIHVLSPEVVTLRVDGRPLTLLHAVLGHSSDSVAEVVLLALYDENLKLLDAVDVGVYENNWFGEVFPIGVANDAIRVNSEHFNSSQGYDAAQLVFVKDDKLTLIDAIYFFSVKGGSYEEHQSLAVTTPAGGPGYWPIAATVHATRTVELPAPMEEGDDPPEPLDPAYDRMITQAYNWSASIGGYVADSDAFERLNAENEAKY
jgi:hypothetical protein